tara:strand:- start:267 stop:515 length:249 start_codon:yes stop_codon:yes gene_type:complete
MDKIKKINIKKFLAKLIFKKKIPKNYESLPILKVKGIDSLTIFKIIIKLESKFKIKLKDNEIFSDKFKNIKNITRLINKKRK